MAEAKNLSNVESVRPKSNGKRGIFSRTKLYLFEYAMLQSASFWIGIAFSVATYSVFNLIAGNPVSNSVVESLAWVFGLMLVFVPTAIITYARTTAEEKDCPGRVHQVLRKIIFYTMLTIVIFSASIFAITAVYSVSRALFGLDDTNSLLSVSAPSFVIVAFHAYFLGFMLRGNAVSARLRKINIIVISSIGTLLAILILGIASINGAGVAQDKKVVKELKETSDAIRQDYRVNGSLTDSVSDLSNLSKGIKAKFENKTYAYKVVDTPSYDQPIPLTTQEDSGSSSSPVSPDIATSLYQSNSYQLCATFDTASDSSYTNYGGTYDSLYSSTDSDIDHHPKGYQCFNLYAY